MCQLRLGGEDFAPRGDVTAMTSSVSLQLLSSSACTASSFYSYHVHTQYAASIPLYTSSLNTSTLHTTTMAPRALISAVRPLTASISPFARRTLSTTPRMAIKEDGNRTPEELEQKKQEQLKEQKEGKGRWREDLASSGESNIAADRQNVKDHESHIKELQQEGKKKGEQGEL